MFRVSTVRLRWALALLALAAGAPALPAAADGWGWHHDHRGFYHGPGVWHAGYWHHGWYGGRSGWWWVVGGSWYWYAAPVYPYPASVSEIYVTPPPTVAAEPAPAPQMWYYCDNPAGYYPYVPACNQPFRPVTPVAPAAPAPAVPPPAAPK